MLLLVAVQLRSFPVVTIPRLKQKQCGGWDISSGKVFSFCVEKCYTLILLIIKGGIPNLFERNVQI
eukprot:c53965_g1_i1 orf=119-316(+)